jgi:hypothetical protein
MPTMEIEGQLVGKDANHGQIGWQGCQPWTKWRIESAMTVSLGMRRMHAPLWMNYIFFSGQLFFILNHQ